MKQESRGYPASPGMTKWSGVGVVEAPGRAHVLAMKTLPKMPESCGAAAAFMTAYEQEQLWRAAVVMADSRGLMLRLTAMFGRRIEAIRGRVAKTGSKIGGEAWAELTKRAQDAVEDVLWNAYEFAAFGLEAVPRIARPKQARGNAVHLAATTASGVASGFVGLPGVLFDIPFTTTAILRSIAQVARDCGEDLSAEDTKRACLEVLAFGGPTSEDDDTETGYWATRIGMSHATVNMLIRAASGRFGVVLSEKFLAQAVPVAGAVAGGALNFAFTDYYQKMALVHFTLRSLDRRTAQPARVRVCFNEMVTAARDRRRISKRTRVVGYLPRGEGTGPRLG